MGRAMIEASTERAQVLRAFCDTIFPAIDGRDDPTGFWQRAATDVRLDLATAAMLTSLPRAQRASLEQLLDVLGARGLAELPPRQRERLLSEMGQVSADAAIGIRLLSRAVLFLAYTVPDANGRNPNWEILGYPGPPAVAPPTPRRIRPLIPTETPNLDADVCVVGSGAGGSVIAAELAARGLSVVVLEAGGYYAECDFNQLELWASQQLFWRGGFVPSADGMISLAAGANLGGGTTINYMHCVRTPDWVRTEWATEFGLDGVDSSDFDEHLNAVLTRIGANDTCSELNEPHLRLKEGAERLGHAFKVSLRNADPARHNAETAGYVGLGDQSGSRQGATNTFLQDAFDRGARIVTNCHADRIRLHNGRATGVEATYRGSDGHAISVLVQANTVVVAGGALETPALLLRSAIEGPALGHNLHLHPVGAVIGIYAKDQRAWWGPPQAGLVDSFARGSDSHGFLLEATQYVPGLFAAALPWRSGLEHKRHMAQLRNGAVLISIIRDRGAGTVTLDDAGEPVIRYPFADARDRDTFGRGVTELARIHAAAGAVEIVALTPDLDPWHIGDDLESFIARLKSASVGPLSQAPFSAHQMGSARMGRDPRTSAANPWGELHAARGVWIGDTSAFPSAVGVNPMVTCMALARRTAHAIASAVANRACGRQRPRALAPFLTDSC
jgi:choline dehydrogenase-like flavoprotein